MTPKQRIKPEEFVAEYMKNGKNGTKAVKTLQPNLTQYSSENKASRLLNNAQVKLLLDKIEDKLTLGAFKGVNRAINLVESDNEQVATTNIWKLIEHTRGTAVQRSEAKATTINLNLSLSDLTGVRPTESRSKPS